MSEITSLATDVGAKAALAAGIGVGLAAVPFGIRYIWGTFKAVVR